MRRIAICTDVCLLKQILGTLRTAGLIAKLSMCQFMVNEVEFFGLGQMLKSYVGAIDGFKAPKS